MMPRITFRRTRHQLWLGNGMGYEPAHYAIDVDGIEVGTILPRPLYGWQGRIGEMRINTDKLADAKAAIRRHLTASRMPADSVPDRCEREVS